MKQFFANSFTLNLLLAVVFLLSVLASAYMLYSMNLALPEGFESTTLLKTYLVIAFTFVIGAITIYTSIRNRKEIIVYREKTQESQNEVQTGNSEEVKGTISLESIKSSLTKRNKNEQLQSAIKAICKQLEAGQGALYLTKEEDGNKKIELHSGYSLNIGESATLSFDFGEGLVGQAAAEGRTLYVDEVPQGYITVISGLGSSSPRYLLITPIKKQDQVVGAIEIASFTALNASQRKFVEDSVQLLADTIVPA
jgi:putative methionine-R-sulfoxide reductase with GAF domain